MTQTTATKTDDIGHNRNGPGAYQPVQAKIDGHLCRILLGTGSGNSYISRELGRRLTTKPCRNEKHIIGTVNGDMDMMCPFYYLEVSGIGKSTGNLKTQFG